MAHTEISEKWARPITLEEIAEGRRKIKASHCKEDNHGDHDEIMARVLWTVAYSDTLRLQDAQALALAALNCEDDVKGRWYS